jgi:hypothetical protein
MDPEIARIAVNEHLRHLDYLNLDEVYAWLIEELWQAVKTFKPERGKTLAQWWWSIWLNRRRKLISHRYTHTYQFNREALYRPQMHADELTNYIEENTFEDARALEDMVTPPCPVPGLLESRVWYRLSLATVRDQKDLELLAQDICAEMSLSEQVFWQILESFRNSKVRSHLTGGM